MKAPMLSGREDCNYTPTICNYTLDYANTFWKRFWGITYEKYTYLILLIEECNATVLQGKLLILPNVGTYISATHVNNSISLKLQNFIQLNLRSTRGIKW